MGIKDINSFLQKQEITYENISPIKNLSGHRIAIDSCNWLYTFMPDAFKKYVNNSNFDLTSDIDYFQIFRFLLKDLIDFINLLAENQITPIFVWDGKHPDDKSETKEKRREDRRKRISKAEELKSELEKIHPLKRDPVQLNEWKKMFVSSTRLPYEYFDKFKIFLECTGIPSITAKNDAEKLCAEMNICGFVIGIWSRDTDLYALGALTMIIGMTEYNFRYIQPREFIKELGMKVEDFRDFCIACECDFNSRIKGMGPMKLFKLFQKHGTLDEIISKKILDNTECLNLVKCRKYLTPKINSCKRKFYKDISSYNFNPEIFLEKAKEFLLSFNLENYYNLLKNNLLSLEPPKNLFD